MSLAKIASLIPVAALGLTTTLAAPRSAAADVAFSAQVTINGGGAGGAISVNAPALSAYGRWVTEPQYGSVFVPNDRGFVPYTRGHWAETGAGLTWVSDAPMGRITEHYGRWVNTSSGWRWVPGDDYAPAWVQWRDTDDYVGWAPLGPDDRVSQDAWRFVPRSYATSRGVAAHFVRGATIYPRSRSFEPRRFDDLARAREDAQRRAEDAQRRAEDAQRRYEQQRGIDNPYAEQARRDAQAQRRAQQQQRRYEQMMRRGGPGADPAADARDAARMRRDLERQQRADAAARRDGFYR